MAMFITALAAVCCKAVLSRYCPANIKAWNVSVFSICARMLLRCASVLATAIASRSMMRRFSPVMEASDAKVT